MRLEREALFLVLLLQNKYDDDDEPSQEISDNI